MDAAALALWLLAQGTEGPPMPACGPTGPFEDKLTELYGETALGFGINANRNAVIAIFRNPATGSWSLLAVRTDGLTCFLAAGEDWTELAPPNVEVPRL